MKKITIWTEFAPNYDPCERTEQLYGNERFDILKNVYPKGMGAELASIFDDDKDISVTVSTFFDEDQGLSEELLQNTDVLIYWAHLFHREITDATVERIAAHVQTGMGIIFLHSAHHSKIIKRLLGTTCDLTWREVGEYERVWTATPSHPIAAGVENGFVIPHEEMYGEPFDIPEPETTVFLGAFEGGEAFRAGVTYTRGYGKIFYFQAGHETFPVYKHPQVRKIIRNAADWAYPTVRRNDKGCPNRKEFLTISPRN